MRRALDFSVLQIPFRATETSSHHNSSVAVAAIGPSGITDLGNEQS